MRKILCAATAICLLGTLAMAQNRTSSPAATPQRGQTSISVSATRPAPPPTASEDFIIGPQDVLDISVWGEPTFDIKVAVRPDGKIGVKLLNDIQAAGLTAMQLKDKIAEGLRPYVPEAAVTVIVVGINSQKVHIVGSGINRPGPYALGGPLTVMELISTAGGLNEYAKAKNIMIFRKEGNVDTKFIFNYETYLQGKVQQNILLKNRDQIIVE